MRPALANRESRALDCGEYRLLWNRALHDRASGLQYHCCAGHAVQRTESLLEA